VKHDTELGEITENDENADPNIVEEEKKSEWVFVLMILL
jgi:hypothetical protein